MDARVASTIETAPVPSLRLVLDEFGRSDRYEPPPNWLQGRTMYGGLTTALALQATLRDTPGLPALKSAQVSFVAPATGPLQFTTAVLRRGRSATHVAVDGHGQDGIALRAAFQFADPRPSGIRHDFVAAPAVQGPTSYPALEPTGAMPVFFANFDVRFASRARPVSGSSDPELVAWVRHRDAVGVDPAVALLAVGDCLPPAAMASFTRFAPISSMSWTLDLPRPATRTEWYLLRSRSERAGDGYSYQRMEAWSEDGTLVLAGSQTVALFA